MMGESRMVLNALQ